MNTLDRYKTLAPWIGMILAIVMNVTVLAYWTGTYSQRLDDLHRRTLVVERSDKEQTNWLGRIIRMEENVQFIRDELKAHRASQDAVRAGK